MHQLLLNPPLNSMQQFRESAMNKLAAIMPTTTITQQAYHTGTATDMLATPHGNRPRQSRTEPTRQSSTLHTHCAHASTVAVHPAEPRLWMGRMIRLVLHRSILCLVLCSLKLRGSGQSFMSAVLLQHRPAHHSWRESPWTPLRSGGTAISMCQEPATKNITISKQCTEMWTSTSSPKCSLNGTLLPAWQDETRKRSTSRGNMEWDRKTPVTRATPPRAYWQWHKSRSAAGEHRRMPRYQIPTQERHRPKNHLPEHAGHMPRAVRRGRYQISPGSWLSPPWNTLLQASLFARLPHRPETPRSGHARSTADSATAAMDTNSQETPKNQSEADSTVSADGAWQEERGMGNTAQPGMEPPPLPRVPTHRLLGRRMGGGHACIPHMVNVHTYRSLQPHPPGPRLQALRASPRVQ